MSRSDAAASGGGPPAWILLDAVALIDDKLNTSTASALTSTGQPIQVTLVAAAPPHVSYFSVECSSLKQQQKNNSEYPVGLARPIVLSVIYAAGDLALLRLDNDYFIYMAGGHPSLQLLPGTCSGAEIFHRALVGAVPVGGDHFVLAAMGYKRMEGTYELHVFRSDRGSWTSKPLVLGTQVNLELATVIALGGGELRWVDLRRGILVCDVPNGDDDPNPRLIPLPKLLPCNRSSTMGRIDARCFRDVVVRTDGGGSMIISCVELEQCLKRVEIPDVSREDVLYDSDLRLGDDDDDTPPYKYVHLGWRILTWHRTVSSNCWRKGALVHADDIVADDALLRQIFGGDDGGRRLTARRLLAAVPTVGLDGGGDVVYIMCKAEPRGLDTWVVAGRQCGRRHSRRWS